MPSTFLFETRRDLRFVGYPIMNVDERNGEVDILFIDSALVEVPFPLFDVNSVVDAVAFRGHGRVGLEAASRSLFCYHRDYHCARFRGAAL